MQNAYPELPMVAFQRTPVSMDVVIRELAAQPVSAAIKRAAYVMFRIESGNGGSGFNNNFIGCQANSGRWPKEFDKVFTGVVQHRENQTGRLRLFLAFPSLQANLAFLTDRVESRGLFVGGSTHVTLQMTVDSPQALAAAYYKEWVKGDAKYTATSKEVSDFVSMYHQAVGFFREVATAQATV